MPVKDRKFGLMQTAVVLLALAIVACVFAPSITSAVNSAVWSEGRNMAAQIQQSAKLFCVERGEKFKSWEHLTVRDMGFTAQDLNGTYFKVDSYSITFYGYNDFLVKVKVTETTKGTKTIKPLVVMVDENGTWGYIE
jgi:hypothetical protein